MNDPLGAPRSAWLLLADEAAYLTREELDEQAQYRPQDLADEDADLHIWTCSPRVQQGDTLLIYYVSPKKAVHFIARAAFSPFWDTEIGVNTVGEVNRHYVPIEQR